jgi:uncharacterized membrane protein
MATQPTSDAPFGLQPNVAAGLAYLLGPLGGIIMLVGGGTNKFVKWSAAQSIVLWVLYIVAQIAIGFIIALTHLYVLGPIIFLLYLLVFVCWIWGMITGFQGKEVKFPVVAGITESIFKSALA